MFACNNWALMYYIQRRSSGLQRRQLRDTLNPFDMPEERFREIYRLPPQLARNIIEEIEEYSSGNYEDQRKIPLHLEVLAVLNFLASGSYQRRVGMDAFANMSQTTISRSLKTISRIITNHLAPKYVVFPQNEIEAAVIKDQFMAKTKVPGILGLVDGTHVALTSLPNREECVYVNRKNYHSINVQIICDSDLKIINCNARYPGSCHDSHILESSIILNNLKTLNQEERQNWLLGDSAYALKSYLIVPFRNPANSREIQFNKVHSKVRSGVERCIGLLKGRWRCLTKARALHYSHENAAYIIYACCVLHNILINNHVPIRDEDSIEDDSIDEQYPHDNFSNNSGRDFLMNFILENNIFAE